MAAAWRGVEEFVGDLLPPSGKSWTSRELGWCEERVWVRCSNLCYPARRALFPQLTWRFVISIVVSFLRRGVAACVVRAGMRA
jgi:hypothetical protein